MAGDHLSARQLAGNYIVQNSLTTTSTCYYRTAMPHNGATSWADRENASKNYLPRATRAGTWLDNEKLTLGYTGFSPKSVTLEIVHVARNNEGYNFFGGVWERDIVSLWGYYGYNFTIRHAPLNDSIGDTKGRFSMSTGDVGGTRQASKTVYSRPVISDYTPHHVCLTHQSGVTTDAMKLYVDGVLTEKITTTANMADIDSNALNISVEDFFTTSVGSFSHACLTDGILSTSEIAYRSSLVNGLPHTGKALAWDATNLRWRE